MADNRNEFDLPPEMVAKLTDSQKINIQIIRNLTSINTSLNDVQHDVSILRQDVDNHDKLLVTGNGGLSMQERLRNLEGFVSSLRYWSRFIGGSIIVQTIAFSIAVLVALIRFLPILEKLANSP